MKNSKDGVLRESPFASLGRQAQNSRMMTIRKMRILRMWCNLKKKEKFRHFALVQDHNLLCHVKI